MKRGQKSFEKSGSMIPKSLNVIHYSDFPDSLSLLVDSWRAATASDLNLCSTPSSSGRTAGQCTADITLDPPSLSLWLTGDSNLNNYRNVFFSVLLSCSRCRIRYLIVVKTGTQLLYERKFRIKVGSTPGPLYNIVKDSYHKH